MSEEQIRQLINECNAFLADKVGFAPEYSIKIKKEKYSELLALK